MKIVAAYLLAVLGGNSNPSAKDLKDILGSVGAEVDEERINLLLSNVKGKDITELIASGREKLASVPSGGGAAVAVAAGGGGGGAAALLQLKQRKRRRLKRRKNQTMIWASVFSIKYNNKVECSEILQDFRFWNFCFFTCSVLTLSWCYDEPNVVLLF
ncbi:hypothetical protein Csa_018220 [Cucumis sativus]|nr:hypothetical protein Csa_018220 [Cucumis sativus]